MFAVTEELAKFLSGGVSIVVSTCSDAGLVSVSRATCGRYSEQTGRVTVHLPLVHGRTPIENVRANGKIAAAFACIKTFEAYQLKGDDGREDACEPSAALAAYERAFCGHIADIGIGQVASGVRFRDVAALSFTPRVGYRQTPGPGAGRPLAVTS